MEWPIPPVSAMFFSSSDVSFATPVIPSSAPNTKPNPNTIIHTSCCIDPIFNMTCLHVK